MKREHKHGRNAGIRTCTFSTTNSSFTIYIFQTIIIIVCAFVSATTNERKQIQLTVFQRIRRLLPPQQINDTLLINRQRSDCEPAQFLYRWFSQWRHQILNRKSRGLLNFYLHQVGDNLEIYRFTSFQPRSVFRFENTAFWISGWIKVACKHDVNRFQVWNAFGFFSLCQ